MTWSSSDKTVATVDDDGLVKAVGSGTATIKVTVSNGANDKELSASCTVKVADKSKIDRVIANDSAVTLSSEGDSATISFTVTGKKVDEFADRVSIRADDGSILRLSNIKRSGSGDSNTYTVTLTAQRAGLTNVSLTIYDASGSHSAQTSVTVEIPSTPTPAPTPTPEPSETPSEEPEG